MLYYAYYNQRLGVLTYIFTMSPRDRPFILSLYLIYRYCISFNYAHRSGRCVIIIYIQFNAFYRLTFRLIFSLVPMPIAFTEFSYLRFFIHLLGLAELITGLFSPERADASQRATYYPGLELSMYVAVTTPIRRLSLVCVAIFFTFR